MRVRVAIPDKYLDAPTIDALLEATTRAGARQIRAGEAPDARVAIRRGAKWKPEPYLDGEHFDLPAMVNQRGWGDCDDWGPYLAASLRASGEDPGARSRAVRSGPNSWHAVTQLSDGRVVDPSRAAGMKPRVSGYSGVHAAAARPMAEPGDGAMAVKRDAQGVWWCRCDIPWGDAHVASYGPGRGPASALRGAVQGAIWSSDGGSAKHRRYAYQLADWLLAHPSERAPRMFSGRTRGSIVGSLLAGAGAVVGAPPPYGSKYRTFPEYQHAIANAPGSQAFWTDPLVAFLFAGDRKRLAPLRITESGDNDVTMVLNAIDWLDGFHAGQWKAVSKSLEALASALDATGKIDTDRAHILDAIGYPTSALYDARVAAERSSPRPRLSIPNANGRGMQLSLPGGANLETSPASGSIIVRF